MIDPPIHMPVLQCYTCYNVTTAGFGGKHIGIFRKRDGGKMPDVGRDW